MRALILVLITLNLALAAWSWHYDKLSSHDDISLVPEIPVPSAALLDEEDEPVVDENHSDSVDESAPTQIAQSADSSDEVNGEQPESASAVQQEQRVIVASEKSTRSAELTKANESAEPNTPVVEKPRLAPVSVPKEVASSGEAEDLSGSEGGADEQSINGTEPATSAANVAQGSESPIEEKQEVAGCIVYGPFERPVEAAQLVQRLQLDGYTGEFDHKNERVHRGRWVLFPVADTTEAEALIAAFNEAGLKDFGLVRKSPMGMAVSAGLYAGERSLNARLDALMKAGFTPKVDNLYRDASFYQVTVTEAPANPEKYGKFLACNA